MVRLCNLSGSHHETLSGRLLGGRTIIHIEANASEAVLQEAFACVFMRLYWRTWRDAL